MVHMDIEPNDAHKALAKLEECHKLSAVITQNIDGLHQKAGSVSVLELHGNVSRNYCMDCHNSYDIEFMMSSSDVPTCTECGGVTKPDVVLYEEDLDEEVLNKSVEAVSSADLLIVGGTSLNIYPAAGLIHYFKGKAIVLINKGGETPYDDMSDIVIRDSIGHVLSEVMWLYETGANNRARFVLGTIGRKPLVCFGGVNPSTAAPGELDPTLKAVERFAKENGFDSYIMLNLYPQRSTNPNGLHKRINLAYHKENLKIIEEILSRENVTVWAAWGGTLIEKRPYLKRCLVDILKLENARDCKWVSIGAISKKGHPHHPLYLRTVTPMDAFDIDEYSL